MMRDTQVTLEHPRCYREQPVTDYTDPHRFQRELEVLFARHWLLAGRVDELPEAGAIARTVAGRELVLTREQTSIRAHHNVCQHRGCLVVPDRVESTLLRCPYHGWAYGLDGTLQHVPREHRFAGLDRASCSLPGVAATSWAGFVWVHLGERPQPLEQWLGAWQDELARYQLERQVRWAQRTDELALNWKASVDAFNETYHVAFIHPKTVGRLVDGAASSFRYDGDHSRMVVPIRRAAREGDRAEGRHGKHLLPEQARDHCNYTLFPNVVLNLLATWGLVLVFEPLVIDRTRVHTTMLVDPPRNESQRAVYDAQWQEFCKVLEEDLHNLALVGRGLGTGATQVVRFGGEEERLIHFHDAVARSLT